MPSDNMDIRFVFKNYAATERMKEFISQRLGFLEPVVSPESFVQVSVEELSYGTSVDVGIFYQSAFFKAERTGEDIYQALDEVVEALKLAIEKQKAMKERNISPASPPLIQKDKKSVGRIVKRKQFDMKPMNEVEAILQMNLLNHDMFMFFNGEIEQMCLLYKRKDGNYGIIEGTY